VAHKVGQVNGPLGRAAAAVTAAAVLVTISGSSRTESRSSTKSRSTERSRSAPVRLLTAGRPGGTATPPLSAAQAPPGLMGAAGLGDRYFPMAGNSGYDVADYQVDLRYTPKGGHIDAAVTISARATQDLAGFDLDFRGPRIVGITVNGAPASFEHRDQELTIRPAKPLMRGELFTTTVRYSGRPMPIREPELGTYGWVPTRDGAITQSEPDGTPTWMPVNDHPMDKATYTFRITVPKDLQVVANGEPRPPVTQGADTTYVWTERFPMASYLAMIAIGRFGIRHGTAGNIPVITAVDPQFARGAEQLQATTIKALEWESGVFGPYPFATAGGVIDDPHLSYALENQERPVYSGFVPDDTFIVHELAHQWFGDSVSLTRWQDIWLNEAFATYAEWLWDEHLKKDSAEATFKRYYRQPAKSTIFQPPPADPTRRSMFGLSVYTRGAMGLQALRDRVGDKAFFTILRDWATQYRYGHGTTDEFIALAEKVSGKPLGTLFHAWLYEKGKPTKW
jgi:aminopeptidase N